MAVKAGGNRLNLRETFTEHLFIPVRKCLSRKDAQFADALVASSESGHVPHFLASSLLVWSTAQLPELPPEVRRSKVFVESADPFDDKPSLDRLIDDMGRGGQLLSKSRSRQAKSAIRRLRDRTFIFRDRCFFEWGVRHFHVYPDDRKRDVLVYAAFHDARAHLLALDGHSSPNDASLVCAMAEICPHLLTVLNGVKGDAFDSKQVKNLRNKNCGFVAGSPIGAVAPRVVCSTSGLPMTVVHDVDYELTCLDAVQSALDDPSSEQYVAIQRALATVEPPSLVVVPKKSNFRGAVAVLDESSGKEVLLTYRS